MRKLFTDPIIAKCIKPFDGLGLTIGATAKIEPNIGNENEYVINGVALVSKETVLEFFNINYLFDFGQAIKHMKDGKKVARIGWNGKGIFIKLQVPDENSKMTHPYIYIDTTGLETTNEKAPKSRVPWLASQTDMLSEDWEVVE